MTDEGASSISVTVRVRPFTIREAAQLTKSDDSPLFLGDGSLAGVPAPRLHQKGLRPVIKVVDDRCLIFDPPEDNPVQRFTKSVVPQGKRVKDQTFGFDRVFDENTTQGDVYEASTKCLLDNVLDGFNATVFAYGATGCGKTHTITGTAQQPGIIFLTMQELFEKINERSNEKTTEVSLSYLEIYNETIRDLLLPGGSKAGLMLREDANQTVSVAGLSSHHPQNVEEVMDMIMKGNALRTMSPTEANATSSRSHAVLQINVSQKDRNADVNEPHTMATLSIIDLAGSERASATKNRGERLIEGANINKSLLALGSCINALCDPRKRNHVPYRNSKLTRLLKFSLGGNCKTVMIVCVSPSSQHYDETQNTLRYANRAKNIQTKVTRNVYNVNRHVKDFLKKIDEQMAMIKELQQQQKEYEGTAFAKFRKQSDKREIIAREGIARIRAAYDNSAAERKEKVSNMRKLRQIERRISMISSWVSAFDGVCDSREDEEPPKNLQAMRKTATGILAELEGSRQHYHLKLSKNNWDRAVESALQSGIRQLNEVDGIADGPDVASLTREAEFLKANADREAAMSVLEQEKGGDAAVVQALLAAHFETIASLNSILLMDEQGAIELAKTILAKILTACTGAASQVIKPDGSLVSNEVFPPTRSGTPKRRKHVIIPSGTPLAPIIPPNFGNDSIVVASPVRGTPKRRKFGGAKKGVSFTPKKRLPAKRGVTWRDNTENGTLAEFEKTPQKIESSPEIPQEPIPTLSFIPEPVATENAEPTVPVVATILPDTSSPTLIPPPPPVLGARPVRSNRFKSGFLARGTAGSPLPASTSNFTSSDSDMSPLRDLDPGKSQNRSLLNKVQFPVSTDITPNDSGRDTSDEESHAWPGPRSDPIRIKRSLRRSSSTSNSTGIRHRRRSPIGGSSPPGGEHPFSNSHARRMVKSEKENSLGHNVLSPRSAPIAKTRRTTIGEARNSSALAVREAEEEAGGQRDRLKGRWMERIEEEEDEGGDGEGGGVGKEHAGDLGDDGGREAEDSQEKAGAEVDGLDTEDGIAAGEGEVVAEEEIVAEEEAEEAEVVVGEDDKKPPG
ncbi:MAG: kinesin-like protein Klp5 [Trizodia sp. TS-e1964]|nr:MAG: kinesin-like protein Klp5 [Trizodia sp. TS-e1964]